MKILNKIITEIMDFFGFDHSNQKKNTKIKKQEKKQMIKI